VARVEGKAALAAPRDAMKRSRAARIGLANNHGPQSGLM
jgi:hypothetical protein